MLRRIVACVVIAALLIAVAPPIVFAQTSSDQVGGGANLNCGHFFDGAQDHAQAVYEADSKDPYGLDGPIGPATDGEPQVACDNAELGSITPPARCENFEKARHAQALLDFTGPDDLYGLDPDDDGTACNGGETETTGSGVSGGASDPEDVDANVLDASGASAAGVQASVGQALVHPYVTYMLAGGVPVGVHAFGLVSQAHGASATGERVPITSEQTASDETRIGRGHDRHKAKHSNKSGGKKHAGKHNRHKDKQRNRN